MRLFTRLSASLAATTSEAVARFENHEAVGAVAIESCRHGVANARAALRRHEQSGTALAARRCEAVRDIDLWTRRAVDTSDDSLARSCLERRQQARDILSTIDNEQHRHDSTRKNLFDRAVELERALAQLIARSADLASREVLARTGTTGRDDGAAAAFERWETSVELEELRRPRPVETDDIDELTARFDADERSAALDAELAELRATGDVS